MSRDGIIEEVNCSNRQRDLARHVWLVKLLPTSYLASMLPVYAAMPVAHNIRRKRLRGASLARRLANCAKAGGEGVDAAAPGHAGGAGRLLTENAALMDIRLFGFQAIGHRVLSMMLTKRNGRHFTVWLDMRCVPMMRPRNGRRVQITGGGGSYLWDIKLDGCPSIAYHSEKKCEPNTRKVVPAD